MPPRSSRWKLHLATGFEELRESAFHLACPSGSEFEWSSGCLTLLPPSKLGGVRAWALRIWWPNVATIRTRRMAMLGTFLRCPRDARRVACDTGWHALRVACDAGRMLGGKHANWITCELDVGSLLLSTSLVEVEATFGHQNRRIP